MLGTFQKLKKGVVMDEELTELLTRLMRAGTVSDGDVMMLREAVWIDEAIAAPVVDALFKLNDQLAAVSPAWTDFFIEAIEYYLVDQCVPQGFVDQKSAEWLRLKIDKNGRVASLSEIELLVAVLERAENTAEDLKSYAYAQIENTIVSGEGPTRGDDRVRPNCVDAAEVELLRRLIFAGGGEGASIVGSQEADMLFRIKDATLHSDNAPSWMRLFVQGLGNHLMAHSDYRPLSRDEAVRLNGFMNDNSPSLARFFGRMLPDNMIGSGTIADAFKTLFPRAEDRFAKRLALDSSHLITPQEAGWLKTHIAADGETDAYEKALLTFILDEAEHLPPVLESFRQQA
jgi:hypothetical protein